VWIDLLTFPGTRWANAFYREVEAWILRVFPSRDALVRPEWSKGWAYTELAAWSDPSMLTRTVPDSYRIGYPDDDGWDRAVARLDAYDPHRVFTNAFLDGLLRGRTC
jgi:hypothetical protein